MDHSTVAASKPGTPVPKIEKRTKDSKIFAIDCTSLLSPNEIIFGEVKHNEVSTIVLSEVQSKQGKYVQFRVSEGPVNVPHTDYLINFTVVTSFKNELTVPVSIRVFSN